jgi:hypothetical protein
LNSHGMTDPIEQQMHVGALRRAAAKGGFA